jgi:hypothetical protein
MLEMARQKRNLSNRLIVDAEALEGIAQRVREARERGSKAQSQNGGSEADAI